MLVSVTIQNFAIIESLTVDFKTGMSVLTGETGAGKSIIIDAVSLLSGARASSSFVRHGSDKAILQALFDLDNAPIVQAMLTELSIPNEDNQLMIYREIHATGKSVIRINGLLSTAQVLKQLTRPLIDIHGQHEHQQLMDDVYHLNLLDQFGIKDIADAFSAYTADYQSYVKARKTLKSLMVSQTQDNQKIQLLKQHIKDIESVSPKPLEQEALREELKTLMQHEKYAKALMQVDGALFNEEMGALKQVNDAIGAFSALENVDDVYANQLLDISEKLKDMSKFVSDKLDEFQFDVSRFEWVQHRLSQYDNLFEKYGNVLEYYEHAKEELDALENKDEYLSKAQGVFLKSREAVLLSGEKLSALRHEKALALSKAIHEQLRDLYMEKVIFEVVFQGNDKPKITASGLDQVVFMVATNAGEPLKLLSKVASGGELSRLMLALKVIFSQQHGVNTLIFDEIDTGVSGRVAQAIAEKMHTIGHFAQVLSVSHLPQVAAIADHHLFVSKETINERTATSITYLDDEMRVVEVAKMFAGDVVNSDALAHAKKLLKKE
ncbi:DNA repair protein RecN [Carnobacteriaceae bacterium zg-ZUI252]|nr:DNA repair protein RecN [Carnobacteriaceae bacterium zg-ZUI252]MBS4770583.1 DNA repair protein RecN [Carnobacteriaceae bacterium zg-ZUI240]